MNTSPVPLVHGRHRRRGLSAVLATLALTATVAACGSDKTDDTTTSSGSGANLAAPVIVDLANLGGSNIEVGVGDTIDIDVPEATVAEWSADIADPTITHFVPGRTDATATFNPGLVADKPGETTVKLEDTSSGATVSFSVRVSES